MRTLDEATDIRSMARSGQDEQREQQVRSPRNVRGNVRDRRIGSGLNVRMVSNRLPVMWDDDGGWRAAPGGLVSAVASLQARGFTCWTGSSTSLGAPPPGAPAPTSPYAPLRPVVLASSTAEAAIDGMANSVLWPALHGLDEHVRYRPAYWDSYRAFNRAFAADIVRSCSPGEQVWVHDYHLLLVPQLIKAARPDLRVGLSLHTPFDANSMADLVDARAIASGLADCDVVGVQTLADVEQLTAFLAHVDGSKSTTIQLSPVSIDCDTITGHQGPTPFADSVRERAGSRRLIVGVDRLDYTKGIIERLGAYDLALRTRRIDPDDVHVVQIAQPSRTSVAGYQTLRVELERVAHQMNTQWRRSDGSGVIEVHIASIPRPDVVAVLGAADIAMVTPRRDGMNLVAKEFSILAEHTAGVLVLSHGAGAAAQLGPDAVVVDGADPHSVADGLVRAHGLELQVRDNMARRRAMTVRSWTAHDWATSFLAVLSGS